MHDVRLFGSKLTNFSHIPKIFRKPSPPLANLFGEPIEDLPFLNVQPPIGTGRPGGYKKRRSQDSWPGYLERHKKNVPKAKKTRGKENRLRGGGSNTMFPGDGDFTWYNSKFMATTQRLEGGGCGGCGGGGGAGAVSEYPYSSGGSKPMQFNNDFVTLNPQYLSGNKCKLRHDEGQDNSCVCPPKDSIEATLKSKGQGSLCTKSRCVGGDCLIKAFKDAQDFVDGLGKVPGLAGLGIVQGPYFNGPGSRMNQPKESGRVDSKSTVATRPPDTSGPCGKYERPECQPQLHMSTEIQKKPSVINPAPVNPPPRKSLVQEGSVAFPDPATQSSIKAKKMEKTDKQKEPENAQSASQVNNESHCGGPKCKARPAKKKEKECKEIESDDKKSMVKKTPPKNSKSAPGLKKRTQYVYNFGTEYPVYGHKHCIVPRLRVPAKQGWSWDKVDQVVSSNKWYKQRTGWRPGAISTVIRDQLLEAKEGFFTEKRPKSAPTKGKKVPAGQPLMRRRSNRDTKVEEEEIEDIEYPPTLHIHRKNGDYYVTMYPIRPESEDVQRLDTPINPLQFKIVKSKASVASSSTASDMEIEFSPPAAVNRLKRKPNVVHTGTQLRQQMILDEYKKLNGSGKKKNSKDDGKGKKDKKKSI